MVCISDARGRTGLEECDYPQAEYCRNALKEALTITAQDIIATGIQGAEIRPALAKARADHLKGWKSTLSV